MSSDCAGVLRTYIGDAKAAVESMGIHPRSAHRYPFDLIALEHVAKVLSIAESCLVLIDAGKVSEAYGLSRSAVEATLSLRYITVDRDDMHRKCMRFGYYAQHVKNFWLYYWRKMNPDIGDSAEVAAEVQQWALTGDPNPARETWINTWKVALLSHPLDPPMPAGNVEPELIKKANYAIDYSEPSQYVHCSQVAMDWLVPEEGVPFAFSKPKPTRKYVPESVTTILLVHTHWIIAYALWGMQIDFPSKLKTTFAEAFQHINEVSVTVGLEPAI